MEGHETVGEDGVRDGVRDRRGGLALRDAVYHVCISTCIQLKNIINPGFEPKT